MLDSATQRLFEKEIELIKHQKENEILKRDNALLEKEREFQALKNKEEYEVRILLLGIGALLLLLTTAFLFGYFKHRKGNAQLLVRNEEILEKNKEIASQKSEIESKIREEEKFSQELKNQRFLMHQQNKKLKEAQETIANQNIRLKTSNVVLEEKFKLRTKELEASFDEMMSLHKQLDHYSYHSAHDLKGPIARILGLCQISKAESDPEKLACSLGLLEKEAKQMGVFLDRIIDGLELKTKPLELREINLSEFVQELLDKLGPQCHSIELKHSIPQNWEVESDLELLTTLCSNIIQNSIDYRDCQKSNSYLEISSQRVGVKWIELEFTDNGLGIDEKAQSKVFEMFFKAAEGMHTGLGLYEAKLVAQKLGGDISLSFSDSEKTQFKLKLPVELKKSKYQN